MVRRTTCRSPASPCWRNASFGVLLLDKAARVGWLAPPPPPTPWQSDCQPRLVRLGGKLCAHPVCVAGLPLRARPNQVREASIGCWAVEAVIEGHTHPPPACSTQEPESGWLLALSWLCTSLPCVLLAAVAVWDGGPVVDRLWCRGAIFVAARPPWQTCKRRGPCRLWCLRRPLREGFGFFLCYSCVLRYPPP